MNHIVLIAHNLRSCHNVGSLLRTTDGLGVTKVFLTGYTPYPLTKNDSRMPHISAKIQKQIQKTALGAESTVDWEHFDDVFECVNTLKNDKYTIAGLEQTSNAIDIAKYQPTDKIALIVGRETEGIEQEVLDLCDVVLEIPMRGAKESFNVVQASAMALYKLTYLC